MDLHHYRPMLIGGQDKFLGSRVEKIKTFINLSVKTSPIIEKPSPRYSDIILYSSDTKLEKPLLEWLGCIVKYGNQRILTKSGLFCVWRWSALVCQLVGIGIHVFTPLDLLFFFFFFLTLLQRHISIVVSI